MARHPLRAAKWLALPVVIEEIARRQLGLSRDQLAEIKSKLPDYMKTKFLGLIPNHFLIPHRTEKDIKQGKFNFGDGTYEFPWGDLFEAGQTIIGLPKSLIPLGQGPLLEPMVNFMLAKIGINFFREKPAYESWQTRSEKFWEYMRNTFRHVVPSLTPGPEGFRGYGFDRFWRAARGQPSVSTGDVPSLFNAISSVFFGQKITGIDPLKEAFWRRKEKEDKIKEVKSNITRIRKYSPGMSLQEKRDQIEYYNQVLRDIQAGAR